MTSEKYPHRENLDLLERILERVESIDRNVEDILDQVGDGFDSFAYRRNYDDNGQDDHGYD